MTKTMAPSKKEKIFKPRWFKESISESLPYCNSKIDDMERVSQNIFSSKNDGKITKIFSIKNSSHEEIKEEITKILQFKILPTSSQRKILFSWVPYLDRYYNRAVSIIEQIKNDQTFSHYSKMSMYYALTDVRVVRKIVKEMVSPKKEKREFNGAPMDALSDQIRFFCSNLKSVLSNLKEGNIKNWYISKKRPKRNEIISIQKKSITPNGLFPGLLGSIPKFEKIYKQITRNNRKLCDSLIILDRERKEFYFKAVIKIDKKYLPPPKKKEIHIASGDPGEVNFLAVYSQEKQYILGRRLETKIVPLLEKIDCLQSGLDLKINKSGKKLRNRKKMYSRINKNRTKIKNIIKELHYGCANFISKKCDNFLLGKLPIQKIISREKFLKSKDRRIISSLSHCKFREILKNKCSDNNCNLYFVTEEFTSQSCGKCGLCSKCYTSRIKECPYCHFKIDRDFNGSRNIFIKYVTKR